MGTVCDHPLLHQSTAPTPHRSTTQLLNAPSTKYALKLKNKFPNLDQHIEQIRKKIKLPGVDQIIKDCPIYYIPEKSAVYQGHWDSGQPHGYGRVVYSDFSYYQGLLKHSQPCTFITPEHHEDSIYIFADGSYYRGEFIKSKFQGKGVLVSKDGRMKIAGYFKDGLPNGKAIQTLVYENEQHELVQSTYEGEFADGVKQGKGRFESDQFVYTGDFYQGKPHGEGELIDYNGVEFKGKFYNGRKLAGQLKSGYGVIRGNYQHQHQLGHGFYEWKDGYKFYIGSIKNDKPQGKGKIYFQNGRIVEGEWRKGHNMRVTKIEQKTQSEIKRIKQEHERTFRTVDYGEGRSEGMSRRMVEDDDEDQEGESLHENKMINHHQNSNSATGNNMLHNQNALVMN